MNSRVPNRCGRSRPRESSSSGAAASRNASSSTPVPVEAGNAIAGIPDTLRSELLARFNDVSRHYQRGHYEAAVLNAGKFCEVVYTILKGRADGKYPDRAEKPRDMVQACRNLENADAVVMGGRALRIQIPRAIPPVYEIRNNRGTGHAGAEVDPNRMDADYVVHACRWIFADLVRAYHRLDPSVAQSVVSALTSRSVPVLWEVAGTRRVMAPAMEVRDRVLVLLYGLSRPAGEEDLRRWTEYQNPHRFRETILPELHNRALIHHDRVATVVSISPLGEQRVEQHLLSDIPVFSPPGA